MPVLRYGDRGLFVRYLQTALLRAKEDPGEIDGIFGRRTEQAVRRFQEKTGIASDGIAGRFTWAALYPYLCGSTFVVLREGETAETLAKRFETDALRIRYANPDASWTAGETVVVPFSYEVTFSDLPYSSFLCACVIEGLTLRYPFLTAVPIGSSVMGRRIEAVRIGTGPRRVGVNAAHHANEWITTPLTLLFLERYSEAVRADGTIAGERARDVFDTATLTLVPLVNPDGVDLVTGAIGEGDSFYESAKALSAFYPDIPFPSGWKANVSGVDLNLGYPAGWENARAIKFAQGYTRPGPRDYVGTRPLETPENRAMAELTGKERFDRAIAYHTQGGEIYYAYRGYAPQGSEPLAERFAEVSGYTATDVRYESGFAGYKDWAIDAFNMNAFTVEAGRGENPLPIGDLASMYAENEPLLIEALYAPDET